MSPPPSRVFYTFTDIITISFAKCNLSSAKVWDQFNPFSNKPWFSCVCSTSLLKTLWEKDELLVTSNSSFSHSVFYPYGELSAISFKIEIVVCKLLQFGKVQNLLFGKGLSLYHMILTFNDPDIDNF